MNNVRVIMHGILFDQIGVRPKETENKKMATSDCDFGK